MSTEFNHLFGLRSLNGKVEAFGEDSLRTRLFTSKFDMGRTLEARDGTFEWDEITFSRSLAPVVGPDAPFPLRQNLAQINRRSAVAHIKESKIIPARKLYDERDPGTLLPNANAVVEREMRDLVNRISSTIEYIAATMNGTATINSTNIPGTETPFTLTYSPNTFTAGASWATAGTDILSTELPNLKRDYEQTCGKVPAQMIIGSTIEGYLTANTEITSFMTAQLGQQVLESGAALRGPMLGGLRVGGLDWTVTEGGYVPDGGSFTRYVAATDDAFLLPADGGTDDVLGMALGRGFVPANVLGPAPSAAALVRPAPQLGFYSYATLEPNPAGVRIYVGWTGLPVLIRPAAVCVLDVVP